jgi:hypothetical protein
LSANLDARGIPATILAGYFFQRFAAPTGAGIHGRTGLKKKDLKRFRDILLAKKKRFCAMRSGR